MGNHQVPLFSAAALAILDRMPFDPAALGRFEYLSGGLMWRDEFPPVMSPDWQVIAPNYPYRYLIAYRASITLGREQAAFCPVWEQVVQQAPNWPGLRPERRGAAAMRRLRAALRVQDRCLAKLESHPGPSGPTS